MFKKFIVFILTAALLCSFASTAFAADPPKTSAPTVGTPANGPVGSAEGYLLFARLLSTGINVIQWRNTITETSSGYVQMSGVTQTDVTADRIEVNFTLQQWNGSSWVTYSTSNNYELNNVTESETIYRTVAHGYYYRVKTVHRGLLDGDSDEKTLYSSYIYVS